jgi:hypothetical protein
MNHMSTDPRLQWKPATDEQVKVGIRNSEDFLRVPPANLDGMDRTALVARSRELTALFHNPQFLNAAIRG